MIFCIICAIVLLQLGISSVSGRTLNVLDFGAVPGSITANLTNRVALVAALNKAVPGDKVLVPANLTFHSVGGIAADGLDGVTLQLDGTLAAVPDFERWPTQAPPHKRNYLPFIGITNCHNLTVTGHGLLDGQGLKWWNKWVLDPPHNQKRPKLFSVDTCSHLLIENVRAVNSPSFHFLLKNIVHAEVRGVQIHVDRKAIRALKDIKRQRRLSRNPELGKFLGRFSMAPGPSPVLEPEDLNTDGIDPSGRDIWIHDCYINNDDDSIAIKPCRRLSCSLSDCTQDIVVENMVLAGFGASIGSVPADTVAANDTENCVRNVTFRNISMPHTGKGVYVKSNPDCTRPNASASISDILYEDIDILQPRWWAIWIGPQQQQEPGSKLGSDCSLEYPIERHCPTQACVSFRNITLRRVRIREPWLSPGVILGNKTNPMQVTFDNVSVTNWASKIAPFPYGKAYHCAGTDLTFAPHSVNEPRPDCK